MSKYIDRDELIKGRVENDPVRIAALCEPTADVAPVEHGKWIIHGDNLFPLGSTLECSVCHEHENITLVNNNYCPNCGAKMEDEV